MGLAVDELVLNALIVIASSTADSSIDWNSGTLGGPKQRIVLDNSPVLTFVNPTDGVPALTLFVVQDGAGSRTVTWPGVVLWRLGLRHVRRSIDDRRGRIIGRGPIRKPLAPSEQFSYAIVRSTRPLGGGDVEIGFSAVGSRPAVFADRRAWDDRVGRFRPLVVRGRRVLLGIALSVGGPFSVAVGLHTLRRWRGFFGEPLRAAELRRLRVFHCFPPRRAGRRVGGRRGVYVATFVVVSLRAMGGALLGLERL